MDVVGTYLHVYQWKKSASPRRQSLVGPDSHRPRYCRLWPEKYGQGSKLSRSFEWVLNFEKIMLCYEFWIDEKWSPTYLSCYVLYTCMLCTAIRNRDYRSNRILVYIETLFPGNEMWLFKRYFLLSKAIILEFFLFFSV